MGDVVEIELASLRAWPAPETASVCGWLFRSAGGYTKRANSANAIEPTGSFRDVKESAENFYKARGIAPTFRLSPLAPKDADSELDEAGYIYRDPSVVLSMPVASSEIPSQVRIATLPGRSWLDGYATANRLSPDYRVAHEKIVRSISGTTGFATLFEDDTPIGFGLAVQEADLVGLFDIVVLPDYRGHGYGKVMTNALASWGQGVGAKTAYLQVMQNNFIARRLYHNLGFQEVYRYHYRCAGASR